MHGVRNYTTPAPPEARDYSLFRKYGRIGAMSAILCHDAAIAGVSACVPPAAVDNLARCTPVCGPEKAATAVKTTGFRTLRVAPPGCGTFDLCLAAARRAVGDSPFSPAGFGALVAVTVTPGDEMPALANRLHRALGFPPAAAALDIRAACAGYVYGLHAAAMYAAATGRPVLLADGDVQTSVADPPAPATLPGFSDAGTATGHSYGEPEWIWSKDNCMAIATFTCANCGEEHVLIDENPVEQEVEADGHPFRRKKVFRVMIRYIAPIFVLVILFSSVANAFGWISM